MERIFIQLCSSFIYMFIMRMLYVSDLTYNYSPQMFLFYLSLSFVLTLFLEAFKYLMVDIIKYTKVIITFILVISVFILYYHFSHFYFTIILYLDFMMIKDLLVSYEMHKSLESFKEADIVTK